MRGRTKALRPFRQIGWLLLLGFLGGVLLTFAIVTWQSIPAADVGQDYRFYRDLAVRWLQDGTYYLPHQLHGPYDVALMGDNLYPPNALLLFVPLVFLPAFLYWLIPAGIVGYALYRWHPAKWAVAGMMALLLWPRALAAPMFGTSDIWAVAAVTSGLLWGWPAVLLILKPTFVAFALVGIRHRTWWIALVGLAALSVVQLPLWFDYFKAMRDLRIGVDYSLGAVPLLLVPIVGWAGRRTRGLVGTTNPPGHGEALLMSRRPSNRIGSASRLSSNLADDGRSWGHRLYSRSGPT